MESPSSSSDERIRLNLGGTIFETTLSTLTKIEGTVLSTMVAKRWRGQGELFIDRDPTHFSKILNYLRDGDEFNVPLDRDVCDELRREAQFYNLPGLIEMCLPQELNVGDEIQWKKDAVCLYWRCFVRYMVDDSLTLPFIYDRNNHTLARCIGCEEYQDLKCSYHYDINYEDWKPMKHHMLLMRGEIIQVSSSVTVLALL
uniref:BTB domain-containing protein n=1 Tax=Angiostrongylus cantonensis TaxID=6313 RepID=A0A0K0DQI5_ANGCA